MDSTKGKYCFRWGLVEAKSPAMFKDFSVCAEECAMYSPEHGTCIYMALKESQIAQIKKKSSQEN